MNVYDFDGTIYDGDSTIDFYLFCLKKKPILVLCLFKQAYGIFLHLIHKIDTTMMKAYFFSFLQKLDKCDIWVEEFWQQNQKKIKNWYKQCKKCDDVVISASPYFLLQPICTKLGIADPIATKVNKINGTIEGRNCKGQEKVSRFYAEYPDAEIARFYTDSISDAPMAKIAKSAFIIRGEQVMEFEPLDK